MPDATHRPAGFHDLTPYLVVSGVDRLIAFLRDAYGGEERCAPRELTGASRTPGCASATPWWT